MEFEHKHHIQSCVQSRARYCCEGPRFYKVLALCIKLDLQNKQLHVRLCKTCQGK
jgi:hypothetical protein